LAFSDAQITVLEAAIARGVLEVQQGTERVKYRSLAEMRDTLGLMKAERDGSATAAIKTTIPLTSRGL